MFLGATDQDRLNRMVPPEQTPKMFEKYLPYALALDVEQDWAEKFSSVLGQAATAPSANGSGYTPSFYSGSSWSLFSGTNFASSFSSSLTSAISSSSSAPGSGGGGGSGGSRGGAEVAEEEGGRGTLRGERRFYRDPTRCTLKVSPRGHFTLFFFLQYGQTTMRTTSLANPVEPTTLIPRWQSLHRKIFCIHPPNPLGRVRGLQHSIEFQCAPASAAGCRPCCGTSCVPRASGSIFIR